MALDESVFVHDRALCESEEVGPRTRVWAFAHIMKGAKVGADCNVCDHAFIETGAVVGDRVTIKNNVLLWDKVTIGNDVFLGPNAVFTNDLRPRIEFRTPVSEFLTTHVMDGATIGANVTVVCGVSIGGYAFVGAGAVVTEDVPGHALVVGNPGRQIGWVCACGRRLGQDLTCEHCGNRYTKIDGGLRAA